MSCNNYRLREILEEIFHALGEPGTPEMDPLGLGTPTTPAAKPAAKPAAGPDSDSPWSTHSSDSDSSQTLELPGRLCLLADITFSVINQTGFAPNLTRRL